MANNDSQYFEYLKQRSFAGLLYRRHYLYPRLSRELIGNALDIGCGIGDFLTYRTDTVGTDINCCLVDYCNKRGLNATVMEADCLPFADETFTSVILDNVLEHIDNPQPLLQEIWRVAKPGGRLIVGVPGVRGYASDADHKHFYSEAQLQRLLTSMRWVSKRVLFMPVHSKWLDKYMSQYCVYGIFDKPTVFSLRRTEEIAF